MITTDLASGIELASTTAPVTKTEGRVARTRRRRRSIWARSAAISLVAHAGLVGAANFVPEAERVQAPISIELVQHATEPPPVLVPPPVTMPPTDAVGVPRAVPPRVRRAPARSLRPVAANETSSPAPPAVAPPASAPLAAAEPAPGPGPVPPPSEGGSGALAIPGGGRAPGSGLAIASGPRSGARSGGGTFVGLRAYLDHVQARVARGQRYPQIAIRMGLDGVAVVRVRVRSDGAFACAPAVATSSGHEVLDREALRMVAQAAPFPALPDGSAPVTELAVPVRFRLED